MDTNTDTKTENFDTDTDKYIDRWLEALKANDGNDFGQVSNFNDRDNTVPSYCTLGVLVESAMTNSHKYRPTMRDRFRNLRERLGYAIGSKIASFDLDNREWY